MKLVKECVKESHDLLVITFVMLFIGFVWNCYNVIYPTPSGSLQDVSYEAN